MAASGDEFFDAEDAETVETIKDLIETRVRPAVAGDGGDITFKGYRDGVVFLTMAISLSRSSAAAISRAIKVWSPWKTRDLKKPRTAISVNPSKSRPLCAWLSPRALPVPARIGAPADCLCNSYRKHLSAGARPICTRVTRRKGRQRPISPSRTTPGPKVKRWPPRSKIMSSSIQLYPASACSTGCFTSAAYACFSRKRSTTCAPWAKLSNGRSTLFRSGREPPAVPQTVFNSGPVRPGSGTASAAWARRPLRFAVTRRRTAASV